MYNFYKYRNGNSIPQLSTPTRVVHGLYTLKSKLDVIEAIEQQCLALDGITSVEGDSTIYVVIIGESYSLYHSSLYGYDKDTNPRLRQRADWGELIVYDDAVSYDDHTHTVMKSLFSFSRRNADMDQHPLFPAVFKKAGYRTSLYDNQYIVGNGISFLNNKDLSHLMFDRRNDARYNFDGDMLKDISVPEGRALVIVHLMGQHYTYKDRYPGSFGEKYFPKDYPSYAEGHRPTLAAYDNSICYTDSIIDALIERLEGKDACVIYLSDHGEEVYDYGDYMGHGNAATSKGLKNQIRVPFMIWGSPSFRQSDVWGKLSGSKGSKIATDDLSHFLMDLAGLNFKGFDPSRSFINDSYDNSKHRIVLNSIDYDAQ